MEISPEEYRACVEWWNARKDERDRRDFARWVLIQAEACTIELDFAIELRNMPVE